MSDRVSDSEAFAARGDDAKNQEQERKASALRAAQRKVEAIERLNKNADFKVFLKELLTNLNGFDFGTSASGEFVQGGMACCSFVKGIVCSAKGGAELIGKLTAEYFKGITPTITTEKDN